MKTAANVQHYINLHVCLKDNCDEMTSLKNIDCDDDADEQYGDIMK